MSSAGEVVFDPGKLWSLWEMLKNFAHGCTCAMRGMMEVEQRLRRDLEGNPAALVLKQDLSRISQLSVLELVKEEATRLDLQSTLIRLNRLLMLHEQIDLNLSVVANDFKEIRRQFEDDLRSKHFLFVPHEKMVFWDQKEPFGGNVSKKFKTSIGDIRCAGNCLALGQGTACVFHLMRAMEVAVKKLASRLQMRITPRTTWRQLTGNMDQVIANMPDDTFTKKRKKENWEHSRANLHHVGDVWRNSTMHPATAYTPAQALDVFNACRVFMNGLCDL
jgi:hypothetical protein